MIEMERILRCLQGNAQAVRAMVETLTDEAMAWKPGPDEWSMKQVIEHLYNEERVDFRKHLGEILSDPPRAWQGFQPDEWTDVETCRIALAGFMAERSASLEYLRGLGQVDWDRSVAAPWGGTISAGDVLAAWVDHDYLHMRQVNEILHAWNEEVSKPYSVRYAGEW